MNRRATLGMRRGGLELLILILLAACAPPGPSRSPTPAGRFATSTAFTDGGTSPTIPSGALHGVAIHVWYPWFGVEASLFESLVAEFNQTNEWGVSVEAASQDSYTELFSNVTAALPGADRPQLVIALPEFALAWDADGYVVDLTDYVDDPVNGLSSDNVRDFPTLFWSQDAVGSRRLGVPAERAAQYIVYDSTWARSLGFATAPRTASEFRLQACSAHRSMSTDQGRSNDGQGGWLVDSSATSFQSWIMAFGGGVLDGNGYRFLTPKNLAALTFVKQLYDDACAWSATPGEDAATAFASHSALFATAGLEQLPDFSRAMAAAGNADTWTVLSFPGTDQSGLAIYGSSYVILKSTSSQQLAAWLFVRWLLSPEVQKKWVDTTGLFPLRKSALALLDDYRKSHPQWSAAIDLIPQGQIQPQLASWREVRAMVGDGFDVMFRSNTPAGRVAEILAIMDRTAGDLTP